MFTKLPFIGALGRKAPNGTLAPGAEVPTDSINIEDGDETETDSDLEILSGPPAPRAVAAPAAAAVEDAPSSKALGKRKAPPSPGRDRPPRRLSTSSKRRRPVEAASAAAPAALVEEAAAGDRASPKKKKEEEKRVTRSVHAKGGGGELQGDTWTRRKRSDSSDSENGWIPPPPLLPPTTVIHFTNRPPSPGLFPSLNLVPDASKVPMSAHLGSATTTTNITSAIPSLEAQTPSFRLLTEAELLPPGRTRGVQHSPPSGVGGVPPDADAHFHRLHRFPEVLEKRSKRREKEKLVHARFNLRTTLEALKNTSDGKTVRSIVAARWKEEAALGVSSAAGAEKGGTEMERLERTRRTMIKEIEETLKRYDALLEPRKESFARGDSATSLSDRAASPAPSSLRSESPAPSLQPTPSTSRSGAAGRFAGAVYGKARSRPSAKQIGPSRGVMKTASGLALRILFRGAGGKFVKSPGKKRPAPSGEASGSKTATRRIHRSRGEVEEEAEDVETADDDDENLADAEVDEEPEDVETNLVAESEPSQSSTERVRRPKPMSTRVRTQDSFFDSPAIRSTVVAQFTDDKGKAASRRRASSRVLHAFGVRVPDSPTLFPMAPLEFDPLRADPLSLSAVVEESTMVEPVDDGEQETTIAALLAERQQAA